MHMAFTADALLFWLKKLAALLVLPPLGPLLLIAAGLLLLHRKRRAGLALAWLGVAAALFLTLPASVGWMLSGLETAPALAPTAGRDAQAIVILGGGKRRHAPEFGGETLNRFALERVRYGARLARQRGLPILVSGGAPEGGPAEADLMRVALVEEFGMPVRWVERQSRDTRENARLSARELSGAGVRHVLLVTHAAHMARAQAEFEAAGLQVTPAPTAWLGGGTQEGTLLGQLPGASAAYAGWYAAHEWLGRLAYRASR